MRFVSKLTMTVAAIFFALSVSAHAGGHDTTSNSVGKKIYQVCKKWRVDQGGWLPTDQMQHCRNVLFCASRSGCAPSCQQWVRLGSDCIADPSGYPVWEDASVDSNARNAAKSCLQDGNC